ncbi:MAG: hypothetical protein EOO46_15710 [Flavobacterium sp.]|nr:MAG: hypothetical protein EOO46_15710 [Flavobacterium sp.]
MKKIIFLLGMMSMLAVVSCKKDAPIPPPPPPDPVVAPAPPPVPSEPKAEDEKDGTTVSVGKEGVDVSTKDGDKKTKVNVSGGDAKVEIKK